MKRQRRLLLAATAVLALAMPVHSQDVTVMGVGQVTKSAVGLGSGGYDRQTSKSGVGYGASYTRWWGANGLQGSYSAVQSNAGFVNVSTPSITLNWGLTRHEFAVSYLRRWHSGLFAGGGAGVFVTKSGWAPGGVVGLDSQFLIQGQVGFTKSLPGGFAVTSGVALDWYRAPNFSDSAYRGGRTVTVEPRVGITWTITKRERGSK